MKEIEASYQKFLAGLSHSFEFHNIDYIGVCLDADSQEPCRFKIYWSDHCRPPFEHKSVSWLKETGLAEYIETVEHAGRARKYQSDIRIRNRTDGNMEQLFSFLSGNESAFHENETLIRSLSRMPITELSGYLYASLYFIGFLYEGTHDSEMLKFHWINRFCKNPDILTSDIWYDDSYYLEYLSSLSGTPYRLLAEQTGFLLKNCSCHLWMTGLDIMKSGWKKYKLYTKRPSDICQAMYTLFSQTPQYHPLAEKIQELEQWMKIHPELEPEGSAFCLDTDNKYSVNLYYGIRESYFQNKRTS